MAGAGDRGLAADIGRVYTGGDGIGDLISPSQLLFWPRGGPPLRDAGRIAEAGLPPVDGLAAETGRFEVPDIVDAQPAL